MGFIQELSSLSLTRGRIQSRIGSCAFNAAVTRFYVAGKGESSSFRHYLHVTIVMPLNTTTMKAWMRNLR